MNTQLINMFLKTSMASHINLLCICKNLNLHLFEKLLFISFLRDIVDYGILNLTEDGILRNLYEKWWHNFTDYCEDPNLDLLPVCCPKSVVPNQSRRGVQG